MALRFALLFPQCFLGDAPGKQTDDHDGHDDGPPRPAVETSAMSHATSPSLDVLKERQPLEFFEARLNLFVVQLPQPIKAEFLHGEGSHHASAHDGPAERLVAEIVRAGQVPHEATCEAIPRPGG